MARRGLTVKELIDATYEYLWGKYYLEDIRLGEGISVEIADDSDYHRQRKGYMIYKSFAICKINSKFWLIFHGEETRGYPANPFRTDLAAISIDSRGIEDEACLSLIESSTYFKNSLIIGRLNGTIEGNKENYLSVELINLIDSRFSSFISQDIKRDKNLIALSDFQPAVCLSRSYKRSFVRFLASSIAKVLGGQD